MHYNVKAVPDALFRKSCAKSVLVGIHEAKGDPLEKENEIKNRSLQFSVYKQFIW